MELAPNFTSSEFVEAGGGAGGAGGAGFPPPPPPPPPQPDKNSTTSVVASVNTMLRAAAFREVKPKRCEKRFIERVLVDS